MRKLKGKTFYLQDCLNTYGAVYLLIRENFSPDHLRECLIRSPIVSVGQYFQRQKVAHDSLRDYSWARNFKAAMEENPDIVVRLDELAKKANKCTTVRRFDRIFSRAQALVCNHHLEGVLF